MSKNKVKRAYEILDTYDVKNAPNPYVKMIKRQYDRGGKVLSEFEVDYIINNHDYEPKDMNRVVKITKELGEKLFEKHNLEFVPEKIRIGRVIGEMGDSLHCYIQYRQSVPPFLAFVSRRGILDSVEKVDWKNYEVDFEPFDEKLSKLNPPRRLKQHQKEAVKWFMSIPNHRAIIADDMGVGKTIEGLVSALVATPSDEDKIIVICPASVKLTWKKEAMTFIDESKIQVIEGQSDVFEQDKKLYIINFDIVSSYYELALEPVYEEVEIRDAAGVVIDKISRPVMVKNPNTKQMVQKTKKSRDRHAIAEALKKSPLFTTNFKFVIIDEAHLLSNKTSNRTKTISDWLKKAKPEFLLLLTGTPISNDIRGFYTLLGLISHPVAEYKNYKWFMENFCGAHEIHRKDGRTVMVFDEKSVTKQKLQELRERVKDCYLRRVTSDVGDMVKKYVETIYFELTPEERERYDMLWEDYMAAQEGESVDLNGKYDDMWDDYDETTDKAKYKALIEGSLMRQFLGRAMIPHTEQMVDELLAKGEKVVIITCFKKEQEILAEYYKGRCVLHNGSMSVKDKEKSNDRFNTDDSIDVFIGNNVSICVGVSLPVSRYLLFNSFAWNSSANNQCTSRIHRLNSTKDVTCSYLVFNNTFSTEMLEKVLLKQEKSDTLIITEKEKK
jgi:SNF2 family DNA or RNA helicase